MAHTRPPVKPGSYSYRNQLRSCSRRSPLQHTPALGLNLRSGRSVYPDAHSTADAGRRSPSEAWIKVRGARAWLGTLTGVTKPAVPGTDAITGLVTVQGKDTILFWEVRMLGEDSPDVTEGLLAPGPRRNSNLA